MSHIFRLVLVLYILYWLYYTVVLNFLIAFSLKFVLLMYITDPCFSSLSSLFKTNDSVFFCYLIHVSCAASVTSLYALTSLICVTLFFVSLLENIFKRLN